MEQALLAAQTALLAALLYRISHLEQVILSFGQRIDRHDALIAKILTHLGINHGKEDNSPES